MIYFVRLQIAVFWCRYFLCDALFKTKDIGILRSSFKQRVTRKIARQKPQFVTAVRHESAPPLAAESAAGKARPSAFRTKPWA